MQSRFIFQQPLPLFRMVISAAEEDDYAWGDVNTEDIGVKYNQTRVSNGAPRGGDSLRIQGIVTNLNEQTSAQFFRLMPETSVPGGSRRYVRWCLRIHSPVVWPSDFTNGGSGPPLANDNSAAGKMIILGNGCGLNDDRPIITLGANDAERSIPTLRLAKDISSDFHDINLSVDTWLHIQHEIQTSTSLGATNGRLRTWINSGNYTTPTGETANIALHPSVLGNAGGCQLQFIDTLNDLSDALENPNLDFEVANFEYGTAFDPSWVP